MAGIDPAPHARSVAAGAGLLALDELGDATTGRILAWSRGRGADAVLVCAASQSSVPVLRAHRAVPRPGAGGRSSATPAWSWTGTPFYEKELSLRFARSYGPGRYDPSYEEWGVDYPAGLRALDRGPQPRGGAAT